MVASGLGERTDVSQYRLAVHLTLACVILSAIVGIATGLRGAGRPVPTRVRRTAWLIVALVVVQIFLGALVAKTGAGLTFNTWPLIDGRLIPAFDQLLAIRPLWRNFFENVITVQFDHRAVAYLLFAAALFHSLDTQRSGPFSVARDAAFLFSLVTGQAVLGVLTLLHMSPFALALAHQAGAVLVLVAASMHAARMASQAARP
jgi:cytochrome c oxidase assembly protein subunit 15